MTTKSYGKMNIEVFNTSTDNTPINNLTPCAVCGNLITTDEIPVLVVQSDELWGLAHRWCVDESEY